MKLIQLTPGAGGMYCGNCFRDNTLVKALNQLGHEASLLPLYLPLTLDEPNAGAKAPTFFGGINVYLSQTIPLYRKAPNWIRRWFDSKALLKWASGRAAKTQASDVGELTLSMLRGESGNQTHELGELVRWIQSDGKPDAVLLSNALLVGFTRRLKQEVGTRVIGFLQGEEAYLDSMDEPWKSQNWETLSERALEVDGWISPSRHFANRMGERLGIPSTRLHVVYNGIQLSGYDRLPPKAVKSRNDSWTIGFFSRMCPEKGLDLVVDAFIQLRKNGRHPQLRLKVGGGCGPNDEAYVDGLKGRLKAAGLDDSATFHPNVSREEKIAFLAECDLVSVPARQSEAFGLYILESLAAGTPLVQPELVTYPELIGATGGGILYRRNTVADLAEAMDSLLARPELLRQLGDTGRASVFERFNDQAMARNMAETIESIVRQPPAGLMNSTPQRGKALRK